MAQGVHARPLTKPSVFVMARQVTAYHRNALPHPRRAPPNG